MAMNDNNKEEEEERIMKSQSSTKSEEKIRTGKSCKGYLYYSSTRKSKGRNPRCVGIPRTLPQVPNYFVGESEAEASKQGRKLLQFYYGCLGYSVYMNAIPDKNIDHNHNHNNNNVKVKTELPVCVGLELIVDKGGVHNPENAHVHAPAPAHVHNKEDRSEVPQPRTYRPTLPSHSAGDDFYNRQAEKQLEYLIIFTRNANVVASGVARNIRRVGNYVKESVEDILFPYRRPPK
ncbi:hypothetical protein ACFE04_021982 [Oxalis oulophora]